MAKSNNFQVRVTGDTTKFDAAMSKAQRTLREFGGLAKSVFGGVAFSAAIKSAVENIANFEKANSELAAVLGTTKKGVEGLAESAKQLGVQTKFSATEVTQLQIALSRLGFTADQIKSMQGAVLNFAQAMNTDLASAADFTGSALRAFGLQAEETEKMLDVLSASTTNSALDFTKLQASLSTVAPIAKSFGLDVKETAAFLGILSNNGFDASSAATALRNILLNLADTNGKLSKGIGHSAKSFSEIIKSFKELHEKGVDVAKVLAMTDKRSAAAAVTIINQADAVQTLKDKLDGAEGSLQTMADTMNNNLIGAVASLKSAWEGLTLTMEESSGPLTKAVNAITELLRAFTGNDKLGKFLRETEAEMNEILAHNLAQKLTNGEKLTKEEQKKYDALKEQGYIVQNGFRELSQGHDAQGYYKTARRSNEYGLWGDEIRVAMTDAEIEAYKAAFEEVTKVTRELTDAEKKELEQKNKVLALMATNKAEGGNVIQADVSKFNKVEIPTELIPPPVHEFKDHIVQELGGGITIAVAIDPDSVEKFRDVTNELNEMIAELASGMGQALGNLFADLTTGENAWGNFANAALSAFGDMAISVGKIAIEMGLASEGIKAALHMDNPYVAIAAGVALIALGTAVKSGLANIANGNYSTGGSVAASSAASGMSNDYEQRDVYVNVTGVLRADGDQLLAVINNTEKKNKVTT